MLFSVAIFAFENEQLANYKAIIAVFSVFIFRTTSLCAQRSSKKCTSIACWTATLFASPQKAWQKRLYHMVASRCKNHFSILKNGYR